MEPATSAHTYLLVCGRGLTKPDEGSFMSDATRGRMESAIAYAQTHTVAGMFLLGGCSKYDVPPPDGITEAGRMKAYAELHLLRSLRAIHGAPFLLTDEDLPSADTIDNAINLAQLVKANHIRLSAHDRLVVVAGMAHYRRIRHLGELTLGLDSGSASQLFEHLNVPEENSLQTSLKEHMALWLLNITTSDVNAALPERQRIQSLRNAQETLDAWVAHKTSRRTLAAIGVASVRHWATVLGSTPGMQYPWYY